MAWVYQFQLILCMNDPMGIVDGTKPCPPKFIRSPTKDTPDQLNSNFGEREKYRKTSRHRILAKNKSLYSCILYSLWGIIYIV